MNLSSWTPRFMLALAAFAMLAQCVSSSPADPESLWKPMPAGYFPSCGESVVNEINTYAGSTIAAIAALAIVIFGLAYSLGESLQRPELKVVAKDELFHLGFSFVLLFFLGIIMTMGCALMQDSFSFAYNTYHEGVTTADVTMVDTCVNQGTISTAALCYSRMMETDAKSLANYYTTENIRLQMKAAEFISYFGILGGTAYGPNSYKRTWAMFVDNLNSMFVLPAYVSVMSQSLLMQLMFGSERFGTDDGTYSPSLILTFILPSAFILRFMPVTRNIGNLLIAFGIGFYLIVPLIITLNGMMYYSTFTQSDCANYSLAVNDLVVGNCDSSYNLFAVARLYPHAFLMPNIILVIFITFMSSINKALRVLG